jgi:hypothetical protein
VEDLVKKWLQAHADEAKNLNKPMIVEVRQSFIQTIKCSHSSVGLCMQEFGKSSTNAFGNKSRGGLMEVKRARYVLYRQIHQTILAQLQQGLPTAGRLASTCDSLCNVLLRSDQYVYPMKLQLFLGLAA